MDLRRSRGHVVCVSVTPCVLGWMHCDSAECNVWCCFGREMLQQKAIGLLFGSQLLRALRVGFPCCACMSVGLHGFPP